MTTGVGGCNKLAIPEFLSKFNADREPPNKGAAPLPLDAAGRAAIAPANGEGAFEATAAEAVEVTPERDAAVDFVIGTVAVGVVPLMVSAAAGVACPATLPDVDAALSVWDGVAGAVTEAMAGRMVNVR